MSIDPEKLMAYADGQLDTAEHQRMEQAIAADPALQEELAQHRRLQGILDVHYGPIAQEAVPERLRALLAEGDELPSADNVVSLAEARTRRPATPVWRGIAAMAASLMVGVLVGQLFWQKGDGSIATQGGAMIAQGGLAKVLETQLASAQDAGSRTRIGLTFLDRQGRPCRTFSGPEIEGLACRSDQRWQILVAAATEAAEQPVYRQAGTSPIMATAEQIMVSEPFDAEAERAAVRAGWRVRR